MPTTADPREIPWRTDKYKICTPTGEAQCARGGNCIGRWDENGYRLSALCLLSRRTSTRNSED